MENDMLSKLGLTQDDIDASIDVDEDDEIEDAAEEVEPPKSNTVLQVDAFDERMGEDLANEKERPRDEIEVAIDEFTDFFAASYRRIPERSETPCYDDLRSSFMEHVLASTEFQAMRESTVFHLFASETAAKELETKFAELKQVPDPTESHCMIAAQNAVEAATNAVETTQSIMQALGCGPGTPSEGKLSTKDIGEAYRRIQARSKLKSIVDMAGRFRRVAQTCQRTRTTHGFDDMIGIELNGDIARLIPSELAALGDDLLELDAMRRILDREAMCRAYESYESVAKGPIVVVVDESGSMQGSKIIRAKAFALAMLWIAKHQTRWMALIGFSGGTQGNVCVVKPGETKQSEILDWLEHFYGEGTTMDVPLVELPRMWEKIGAPAGNTDVIMLTDALCEVPESMRKSFLEWKSHSSAKLFTLLIGERSAGDLQGVSDAVHLIDSIDPSSESVKSCFSI